MPNTDTTSQPLIDNSGKEISPLSNVKLSNSLTSFMGGLGESQGLAFSSQLSKTTTQYLNLRYYLISNDRQLLSYMYTEHGIVQTLVDAPVDDAFREGIDIKTKQLDGEQIEELETYIERNRVIERLKEALKWTRLYGGGGIIVNVAQKYDTPLEMDKIKQGTELEFIPADMWEMLDNEPRPNGNAGFVEPEFYNYYGKRIHKSRFMRVDGKAPPSFLRPRLRGWGMSEIERLIRSINQYMKNQDVVFELMDEAKIDVYKVNGFNNALSSAESTQAVTKRFQMANMLKNFQNAIVMDANDEYDQKTMNFAGLGDMLKQIREGVASDMKMPVTKLFGISSAGFNSGEDDIENYNSMIESEIRSRVKYIVVDVLAICCQHLFGMIPDDLAIEFPELRMMSTEQMEIAKTNQFNRIMACFQNGVIDGATAQACINAGDLLPLAIDDKGDLEPPIKVTEATDYTVSDSNVEG